MANKTGLCLALDDVRFDYAVTSQPFLKAHNIYGMQMARATYMGVKTYPPLTGSGLPGSAALFLLPGPATTWFWDHAVGQSKAAPQVFRGRFMDIGGLEIHR